MRARHQEKESCAVTREYIRVRVIHTFSFSWHNGRERKRERVHAQTLSWICVHVNTGWRRCIGCLLFVGHFLHKSL